MRWAILIGALGLLLAGCGAGNQGSRQATVSDLGSWLHQASECPVEVEEWTGRSVERFADASAEASIECRDWLSGWIAYYDFPSTETRSAAVRGRAPLRRNQLYCTKGPELVVNELDGYDYTADFCKRLGFAIHRPTRSKPTA
jgi:hypothetical protein